MKIKFLPDTTLESRTLLRIALTLWDAVTPADIAGTSASNRYSAVRWVKLMKEMVKKIQLLRLPVGLKIEVKYFVIGVGCQLAQWNERNQTFLDFKYILKNSKNLCWRPQGTIDKLESAKILLEDENLTVRQRYGIACTYCLEKSIYSLIRHVGRTSNETLVQYWSCYVTGRLSELTPLMRWCRDNESSHHQYAFVMSAHQCNEVATEYFYKKLPPADREKLLMLITTPHFGYDIGDDNRSDVFCFLLSKMKERQLMEVIPSHADNILRCFIKWPRQSLFMDLVNTMWQYLSRKEYYLMLELIAIRATNSPINLLSNTCDYKILFKEFWEDSPVDQKKRITEDPASRLVILSKLFESDDRENIMFFLQDRTLKRKDRAFTNNCGFMERQIIGGRTQLLTSMIKKFVRSKRKMTRIKRELEEYIECAYSTACFPSQDAQIKSQLLKYVQVLDGLVQELDPNHGNDASPKKVPRKI